LPPYKLEKLTRKKAFIEAKLADPNSVNHQWGDRAHCGNRPQFGDRPHCGGRGQGGDRTQFWQERLNHINATLEQPDLSPERRETLTRKKEHLTAKLAGGANSNCHQDSKDKTWFFQMRLKHINDALAHPDLPAQRRENLTKKKEKFEEKLAACQNPTTTTAQHESPCGNAWGRPHWGGPHSHHGGPHHGHHGGPHHGGHHGGPHHGPHGGPHHGGHFSGPHHYGPHSGFGCPPAPESVFACPAQTPTQPSSFGCTPTPGTHGHGGWGRGGCGPHRGGPHRGGCGRGGNHLESKLAWVNSVLEQPGLPAHRIAWLTQKKANVEAKIAQQKEGGHCEEKPERAELVALRQAVGASKVNLKNARQSGLKDAELSPFIDAVANAKAALTKRRLELKSACPQSL